MTRHHLTLAALLLSATFAAQAQTTRPDDTASMVKPPSAPGAPSAGARRPDNPDDMPVKRPNPPQNSDRMLHNNPASDAIAK